MPHAPLACLLPNVMDFWMTVRTGRNQEALRQSATITSLSLWGTPDPDPTEERGKNSTAACASKFSLRSPRVFVDVLYLRERRDMRGRMCQRADAASNTVLACTHARISRLLAYTLCTH